ncbi:DJ-1 family glyoxalase III [Clostridium thailandense]|uniref:DJ-1/PfpI family protein n=1 Tax=Clostridium thailandense TaxID=2794346 RepID=A0A949X144_9CLOT|nr:DJ-1 family glyoxalase III [Clostridium thailandense]MBV7271819.1 DJ-1/PfpI family protein [Clostridium thailandense]MCH5135615.1 DJ-1/PfpI family protein [Clostridiaceae bacterium UIB06]
MKKAIVLLAKGFEEVEALAVVDVLRRGGVHCITCSINGEEEILGSHSIHVKANNLLEKTDIDKYDALIIPGGMPGAASLRDSKKVIELVKKFNNEKKLLAAICAGPIVLAKADIISGKRITCYPGFENELGEITYCEDIVVQDDNIITSRGPATALYFGFKILENLADKETVENLKEAMMVKFVEEKFQGEIS